METSFGLRFHLKKPKDCKGGNAHVYMSITVNGIIAKLSTKRKCNPDDWNVATGRLKGKPETSKEFNAYLDTLRLKVFEGKRKLIEIDKELSAENFKNIVSGKGHKQKHMLLELFQYHNDQMAALVNKEYAPGTLERYKTSYKHTQSFLAWKYKLQDIDVTELDYEFISEYAFWLKSVRKCNHNTSMKYLANFKKIIINCIKNNWLRKDPFIGFKMTKREVNRIALTDHELEKISNTRFSIERLEVVKNIFLFSCYTGLAYADVQKLKRSEVEIGVDGEQWIFTKRQKTDSISRIPLLRPALKIISQYQEDTQCKYTERVLPVLSNQKMNSYLKEIADLCGIDKNLTYHIARHTFATTVTLSNGVPIETVSKMLGHRNIKTTQHYAKISGTKISEDMGKIKHKF